MVVVAILGIVSATGLPALTDWIRNTRVHSTAEAVQGALQTARSEAIRANRRVFLSFTSSLDDSCAESNSGPGWVISLCPVIGKCGSAADKNASFPSGGCGSTPLILAKGTIPNSTTTSFAVPNPRTCFGALGMIIDKNTRPTNSDCQDTLTPSPQVAIDVSDLTGSCVASGGDIRCLRIGVTNGGLIRMCDPAVTASDDPRKC